VSAIKIGDNIDTRSIELLETGLLLVVTTDEAVFLDIDSLPLWSDYSCELTTTTDIIKNKTYDYIPCPVNDIARHDSDLYMSISSTVGRPNGNQIIKLNLDSRKVTDSYPVGPEPESVAVSDDASRIYVALDGISQFEEIDVATKNSLYRTEVGSDFSGHYSVGKIQTRPDNLGEVAVLVVNKNYLNDPSERLTLFSDGIEQTGQDLLTQNIDKFGFIDSDTIAGIHVNSTGWRYHAFSVSSAGVDLLMKGDISWEFGFQTDMTMFDNQLIGSSGVVLDISNPLSPVKVDGFDTGINTVDYFTYGGLANSKVIVDEDNRDVYVYAEYLHDKTVPVIQRFDFDTKEQTGEISLPRYGFSSSAVTAFDEHNDTIVISSGQGVLFLNKMLFDE
jgi:DNA-binding beta-propeller fold protein YncE